MNMWDKGTYEAKIVIAKSLQKLVILFEAQNNQ